MIFYLSIITKLYSAVDSIKLIFLNVIGCLDPFANITVPTHYFTIKFFIKTIEDVSKFKQLPSYAEFYIQLN